MFKDKINNLPENSPNQSLASTSSQFSQISKSESNSRSFSFKNKESSKSTPTPKNSRLVAQYDAKQNKIDSYFKIGKAKAETKNGLHPNKSTSNADYLHKTEINYRTK